MANEFTWEITEVNPTNNTMVVKYTTTATSDTLLLNIPIPVVGEDMDIYVSKYRPAPVVPAPLATVVVGQTGVYKDAAPSPEATAAVLLSQQEADAKIALKVQQELATIAGATV